MAGKTRKMKGPSQPRPAGRPPLYTPELGNRICSAIAGGKSLVKVCAIVGMPNRDTVYAWMRNEKFRGFADNYARACEERWHYLAEDALRVAEGAGGLRAGGKVDPGAVQAARLEVDTKKWFASKLHPKVYGERVAQEVSGPGSEPLAVTLVPKDWDAVLAKARVNVERLGHVLDQHSGQTAQLHRGRLESIAIPCDLARNCSCHNTPPSC